MPQKPFFPHEEWRDKDDKPLHPHYLTSAVSTGYAGRLQAGSRDRAIASGKHILFSGETVNPFNSLPSWADRGTLPMGC